MDEGPFRAPRPVDRRAVNRPEPAYRQPEEPQQQSRQEPQPADRKPLSQQASKQNKSSKRFKLLIILIILILAGAVVGSIVWSTKNNKSAGTAIDSSKYQALFLTNDLVYFGKLNTLNDKYFKLTDIYYLQTKAANGSETNPQETSTSQSDVQLIKLGEEIHGPEDEMIVSKDQVLFYENIKADGKVAQSIASYKKTH